MAYTRHGHQIAGTPVEGPWLGSKARCGGPGSCASCSKEAASAVMAMSNPLLSTEPEYHDQTTVVKVLQAMRKAGIETDMALEAIKEMSMAGIVFREKGVSGDGTRRS